MLYKYSQGLLDEGLYADYFVFGHRHLPTEVSLNDNSILIILGDWLTNFTYAEFDGQQMKLKYYN